MGSRAAFLSLAVAAILSGSATPALHAAPDPLLTARRLYNEGQLDAALAAARQAAANPSIVSSARLVMGRIHLERYRQSTAAAELDYARGDLRAVDPRADVAAAEQHERAAAEPSYMSGRDLPPR